MGQINSQENTLNSLRQILIGKDPNFDKALLAGKVQLMRLKNIAITFEGQDRPDLNLFDLFLDHQDDALFEDYVREHTPTNASLLVQAAYVVVFIADGNYSRFAGVYKICGKDKSVFVPCENQNTIEEKVFVKVSYVDAFDDKKGRFLIDWGGLSAQRWLQWFKNDKEIIREDEGIVRIPIPFVSYNDILLPFKELKNIIETDNINWREKLKAVYGIYGIADRNNGNLYVGSAYGNEGIWGRWKTYVETNGHGNNDMLVEIINEDPNYAWKYFQWFVLETFPLTVSKDYAIKRENLYKQKLCTRKFGYNKN